MKRNVKEQGKRLLTLVLIVALVCGLLPGWVPTSEASENAVYDENGFRIVTPETFGIEDTVFDNNDHIDSPSEYQVDMAINKVKFCAEIEFASSGWSLVDYLHNSSTTSGIRMGYVNSASPYPRLYNYLTDGKMYVGGYFDDEHNYIKKEYDPIECNQYFTMDGALADLGDYPFYKQKILLWYTTELVDFDGDGYSDDLQLGVWFNEELYRDTYFYILDCWTHYTGRVRTAPAGDGIKSIASPHVHAYGAEWQSNENEHWKECSCGNKTAGIAHETELQNVKESTETQAGYTGDQVCKICGYVAEYGEKIPTRFDNFRVVTPATFGIEDTVFETTGNVASPVEFQQANMDINGVKFCAEVGFDSNGWSLIDYLETTTASGIRLVYRGSYLALRNYLSEGNLYVGGTFDNNEYVKDKYDPIEATKYFEFDNSLTGLGNESLSEKTFILWYTTELVDFDKDGDEDDLKLGVWFNEKLYDDMYFYVQDCPTYKGKVDTENGFKSIKSPHVHFGEGIVWKTDENKHWSVCSCGEVSAKEAHEIELQNVKEKTETQTGYTGDQTCKTCGYVSKYGEKIPTRFDEFKVVTPMTVGVEDTVFETPGNVASPEEYQQQNMSIDKVKFCAEVGFDSNGWSMIDYLKTTTSSGIRLIYRSSYLQLRNYLSQGNLYAGGSFVNSQYVKDKYEPIEMGANFDFDNNLTGLGNASLSDMTFILWYTTELVDFDGDGNEDDLKLGVWFNGKLYDNMYFYVQNCPNYTGLVKTLEGFKSIKSPIIDTNDMGAVGGEYQSSDGEFFTSELVANKELDGTTFRSGVRFKGEGGVLYYGCGEDNEEKAIKVIGTAKGVRVTHTYGTREVELAQFNIGTGNVFDLELSTEIVDSDADQLVDDVKLGIWVDNQYSCHYLVDAANTISAKMGVKSEGTGMVLFGNFATDTPDEVDFCLNEGIYTQVMAANATRFTVDGQTTDTDVVLSAPGTYSVVSTEGGYVHMQDVTLYKENDINANNKIEILDLVRMLKVADVASHEQTVDNLTKAGKKAIGYEGESAWTTEKAQSILGDMRKELIMYTNYTDFARVSDTSIQSASYINISDFIDATISAADDTYSLSWHAYRADHMRLYTYEGALKTFSKQDVLQLQQGVAYIKVVVTSNGTTIDPTQLSDYGLEVRVRNLPGSRQASVTALDKAHLMQFADLDGAYTNDFTITATGLDFLDEIWILSCTAKYETTNGEQPTIRYELIDASGNILYYALPYVVGAEDKFECREWRVPPTRDRYDTVRISFVIPEGVTLYINDFCNTDTPETTSVVDSEVRYLSHSGLLAYAPANTAIGFDMAGQMGYKSLITIPKFTKPTEEDPIGVGVCFHDDNTIRRELAYSNGTGIAEGSADDKPVEEFTYDELQEFDAGIYKSSIYKGTKVPTLDEFFSICARYDMEPIFSVHPGLTTKQWEYVRDLLDKYNLRDKFYMKATDSDMFRTASAVFGDTIGGYTLLQGASVDWDMYGVGVESGFVSETDPTKLDFKRYNIGVEFFQTAQNLEAKILKVKEQGFTRISVTTGGYGFSGQDFTRFIELGVTEFTVDNHCSLGLNW